MDKITKDYISSLERLIKNLENDLREEKKKSRKYKQIIDQMNQLNMLDVKSCDDCSRLPDCKSLLNASECDYFQRVKI